MAVLQRAALVLVTAIMFLAAAECQGGYDRRRFRQMEDEAIYREVNPMDIKVSSDPSLGSRSRPRGRGSMAAALSTLGHNGLSAFDVIAQAQDMTATTSQDSTVEGTDDGMPALDVGGADVDTASTGDALSGLSAYDAILQGQGPFYPVRQGSLAIGMRHRRPQQQQRQRERGLARLRGQGHKGRVRDQARTRQLPGTEQTPPSSQGSVQENSLPPEPFEGGEESTTSQTQGQSEGEGQGAGQSQGEDQDRGEGQDQGEGPSHIGGEVGLLGVEGPLGPAFVTARTAYDYLSSQTRHGRPRTSERRSETDTMGFGIGEDLCELFGKHLVRTNIGGRCE